MKANNDYETLSRKVIDALDPDVKRWVCKIDGIYWIHSPLFITFGLKNLDPAEINQAYRQKQELADEYRADIRFAPLKYLALHTKPYRLDAFLEIENEISDAQYWRCLEYVWSITEYVHQLKYTWLNLFESPRRYRALMMERKDRKHFQTLPDILTIFRGYQYGKYSHKTGLSWTLSKEKAVWFAYRRANNGKPAVVTGVCKKSDVICYTNGREEQEIIINPANIRAIKSVADIGPSPFQQNPGA